MQKTLDNKISSVLVSPCRVDILNNLVTQGKGISLEEISKNMVSQSAGIQDHLKKLLEDAIIEKYDDKYYLTNEGKRLYKIIQQVVEKTII